MEPDKNFLIIFFYNLLSNFGFFVENMSIIEKIGNSALVKFVV